MGCDNGAPYLENNIRVSNLDNGVNWEKALTDDEAGRVKAMFTGKESVNFLKACIIPVRTHNLKDFAKDFFLPSTFNHAIKVQHAVGKIFVILNCLIIDVFTFPIRLVTCIPRVISNANQKPIAFHQYLIDQRVDPRLLEANWVRVRLSLNCRRWESGFMLPYGSGSSIKKNINFIELPANGVNDSRYFTTRLPSIRSTGQESF